MEDFQAQGENPEEGKRRNLGCAILGWTMTAIFAAFLGYFGHRVWFYYDAIKSGEIVQLPQFGDNLTAASGTDSAGPIHIPPETLSPEGQPAEGPEDARLTVTVFADFECPYSKDAYHAYRSLMATYSDKVRFVYRDFPIEAIHPSAKQASNAAECAREQNRFWAYHDKLFANTPSFGFEDLVRYADEIGLDKVQFERCLAEARYATGIEADMRAGANLGVRGTPTFFFNGRPVEGAIPQADLEALIQRMLK